MTGRAIGNRLSIAQARAEAARAKLAGTIGELQKRAKPQALAHDVAETLKERGMDAVAGVVGSAKRRPVHAGMIVAVLGLFFARHRLIRLFRRPTAAKPRFQSPE